MREMLDVTGCAGGDELATELEADRKLKVVGEMASKILVEVLTGECDKQR